MLNAAFSMDRGLLNGVARCKPHRRFTYGPYARLFTDEAPATPRRRR